MEYHSKENLTGFLLNEYRQVGNKASRNKLKSQCDKKPMILNGSPTKAVKVIKYLGNYLTYSLEESVHETVVRR